jgi:hypothetical protein
LIAFTKVWLTEGPPKMYSATSVPGIKREARHDNRDFWAKNWTSAPVSLFSFTTAGSDGFSRHPGVTFHRSALEKTVVPRAEETWPGGSSRHHHLPFLIKNGGVQEVQEAQVKNHGVRNCILFRARRSLTLSLFVELGALRGRQFLPGHDSRTRRTFELLELPFRRLSYAELQNIRWGRHLLYSFPQPFRRGFRHKNLNFGNFPLSRIINSDRPGRPSKPRSNTRGVNATNVNNRSAIFRFPSRLRDHAATRVEASAQAARRLAA